VFAGGFGELEQEPGAGRLGHQLPGFVDDDEPPAAPCRVRDGPPDRVQGEQYAGGPQLVRQAA
jgi:hypothetical protein